jgi:hypothetical protein
MHPRQKFATRAEARAAVMEHVETGYSRQRRHSTIDCQIPTEKMAAFFERTAGASEKKEVAKLDLVA